MSYTLHELCYIGHSHTKKDYKFVDYLKFSLNGNSVFCFVLFLREHAGTSMGWGRWWGEAGRAEGEGERES